MEISVVIPAYNEEARITETINHIHNFLTANDFDFEIIVVDDGSKDKTCLKACNASRDLPNVRVIHYKKTRAKDLR